MNDIPTSHKPKKRIFVYASGTDPDLIGFTFDETGANLPSELGPWYLEDIPGTVVIDEDDDPIAQGVRRHGFQIVADPPPQLVR